MNLRETPEGDLYRERFAQERERLLGALGPLTEGGVVEGVEHVGATSVAGLGGQPTVDIALAGWPFPLEEPARASLANLGYTLDPEFAGEPEQRYHSANGDFQLYLVAVGSPLWRDYALVREYLRHDATARDAYSARKREWSAGADSNGAYAEAKRRWLERLVEDARRSWIEREGFAPLRRMVAELAELPVAWRIGGGWALDLFQGRVTRVHHDVDVEVARADQFILRTYLSEHGWKLLTPFEQRLGPWPAHMRLELPRHQVHAHRDGAFIDFMLTDMEGGVWRFRREPSVVRDASRIELRSADGIPFIAPELALLFKCKTSGGTERAKDQTDFEVVHTLLEPERRAWLHWALMAYDPTNAWLARL
jgi:GrpB-like predicted nucleotidyltransferase (UPF0157 family)